MALLFVIHVLREKAL